MSSRDSNSIDVVTPARVPRLVVEDFSATFSRKPEVVLIPLAVPPLDRKATANVVPDMLHIRETALIRLALMEVAHANIRNVIFLLPPEIANIHRDLHNGFEWFKKIMPGSGRGAETMSPDVNRLISSAAVVSVGRDASINEQIRLAAPFIRGKNFALLCPSDLLFAQQDKELSGLKTVIDGAYKHKRATFGAVMARWEHAVDRECVLTGDNQSISKVLPRMISESRECNDQEILPIGRAVLPCSILKEIGVTQPSSTYSSGADYSFLLRNCESIHVEMLEHELVECTTYAALQRYTLSQKQKMLLNMAEEVTARCNAQQDSDEQNVFSDVF